MPRRPKLARGPDSHTKKEGAKPVESKGPVRRFHDQVITGGNLGAVDELRSPDLVLTVEDIIAEGDRVACRFTAAGTHQGDRAAGGERKQLWQRPGLCCPRRRWYS